MGSEDAQRLRKSLHPDRPGSRRHSSLRQFLVHGRNQARIIRRHVRRESGGHLAVAADQEFFEVPENIVLVTGCYAVGFQALAHRAVAGRLHARFGQLPVKRVLGLALHRNLREDREGDIVSAGAEIEDLGVGAGLLALEVVGGESGDDEAALALFAVKFFKPLILRREPAFRGDVDDQQHPALVFAERGFTTIHSLDRDIQHIARHGNLQFHKDNPASLAISPPMSSGARSTRRQRPRCRPLVTPGQPSGRRGFPYVIEQEMDDEIIRLVVAAAVRDRFDAAAILRMPGMVVRVGGDERDGLAGELSLAQPEAHLGERPDSLVIFHGDARFQRLPVQRRFAAGLVGRFQHHFLRIGNDGIELFRPHPSHEIAPPRALSPVHSRNLTLCGKEANSCHAVVIRSGCSYLPFNRIRAASRPNPEIRNEDT
ncbi:hypothetical protein RHECNPAF_8900109 [Rhizobium etli CNPAF512]|nr:hypothetical protein RHECNPAF_8900109 [Rhizobium etli CNPAF512]